MLDRSKLTAQLTGLAEKLFPDLKDTSDLSQKIWKQICNDKNFLQKVEQSKSIFLVPTWQGNLGEIFNINSCIKEYSVLSVDGSQVYPDRNFSGANCFLINLGTCFLEYSNKSSVKFFTEPKIFLPQDFFNIHDKIQFSRELVDLLREGLELKNMLDLAVNFKLKKDFKDMLCFIDGSLIFWFLESKQKEVKDLFLNKYLYYLEQCYKNNILNAGFISFPKSRELINLIKLGLCDFKNSDCIQCKKTQNTFACNQVDELIDTSILRTFLKKFCRTTIFYSRSKIVDDYDQHLKPCFFYLNIGPEIVRIEIPFWIAQNSDKIDLICKIAIDQCTKGGGYPVVLAEAHEQAVVKGPDRDFFYHMIQKIGIEKHKRFYFSQKSLKKRGMGI
ncbi:DNA double-strand break repair nuclease NurA [Candidatus Babeliales bacterium]|nr:DNA double-strand break repair nuclease NurA [Candidatus Babeliales bacterium]MCF7899228.1 DNA double-strand break repair nuclease NurA [Candidatus Babeliales bacterium]